MLGAPREGRPFLTEQEEKMNEPLLIARVRKDTKITVPAGGWIILVGPDEPFARHTDERRKLLSADLVNDTYSQVEIGRLRNMNTGLRLITTAERKERDAELAANEEALEKGPEEAKNRQAKLAKDQADKAQKAHEEKVAEVSKENDAIREKKLI